MELEIINRAKNKDYDYVNSNLDNYDLDYIDDLGNTLLMYVIKNKWEDLAEIILSHNLNTINQLNKKRQSALSIAVKKKLWNIATKISKYPSPPKLGPSIFKIYTLNDFLNVETDKFESGSYGEILPVIEISTSRRMVLKRYLNNNNLLGKDIIKELVYINLINRKNLNVAVNLYGICIVHTNIYLVLEPLTYTLEQYLENIKEFIMVNPEIYRKILTKVAYNLDVIHSLGIIHNDLKAQNIMMDDLENIKIIDFGLSDFIGFGQDLNLLNNSSTTEFIKSFDNDSFFIIEEEVFFTGRKSYTTDVFALGCFLICFILGKINTRYIYDGKNLYSVKLNRSFRLVTDREIHIINYHLPFRLLCNMVHYDSRNRYSAKEILQFLNESLVTINRPLNLFTELNVKIENCSLCKNLINYTCRYTKKDFEKNNYELKYMDEIFLNFKDMYLLTNSTDINFQKLNSIITLVMKSNSDNCIDWLINLCLMFNNSESEGFLIYRNFNNIFNFYQLDDLKMSGKLNLTFERLRLIQCNLLKNKYEQFFNFKPISLFIEFIVIHMQKKGFLLKQIYNFEINAFYNILHWVLLTNENEKIWDLIQTFFIDYIGKDTAESFSFIDISNSKYLAIKNKLKEAELDNNKIQHIDNIFFNKIKFTLSKKNKNKILVYNRFKMLEKAPEIYNVYDWDSLLIEEEFDVDDENLFNEDQDEEPVDENQMEEIKEG